MFVSSTNSSITIAIEPVVLTDAPLTAYQLQVEMISSGRRKRIAEVPGYVTAELSKENVTQRMNFVVGDNGIYGGYLNKLLQGNSLYTVHYVVISTFSGVTKYSSSSLSPPVRTVPYNAASAGNADNTTDILIGVIVGLGLLILLALLIILLYWCWRNRNRFIPYTIQENDKNEFVLPELNNDYDPEKYWSTVYNLTDSRHIVAGRDLVYREKQHPQMKEAAPHSNLPKVSFHDEFHKLPHSSRKATNIVAQENKELNRFSHLLPYDHSLVKLKPDSSSRGTYINASFIPGYKKTPAYIAAQSPYDETTVLDFWRLIYQK